MDVASDPTAEVLDAEATHLIAWHLSMQPFKRKMRGPVLAAARKPFLALSHR